MVALKSAWTVLVTGAFGNLGRSVVQALVRRGHRVRAFDLHNRRNARAARALPPGVDVVFGDVTSSDDVARAVAGVDAVAHLAAILPPLAERQPALARAVNLEGTRALVDAAQRRQPAMPFVFTSSCSVYGPRASQGGPATAESPTEATDVYTETKLAAEAVLRASSLAWVVLRLGAAVEGTAARDLLVMRLMFEIAPDHPIELVHGADVANAVCAAVETEAAYRTVLPIGGGPTCQVRQRDMLELTLGTIGVRRLPPTAFGRAPYYTCWLDSSEAQRLLGYQQHDLAAIERDFAARFGVLLPLLRLAGPLTRQLLLRLSGPNTGAPPRPTWKALIDAGY